jgi:tetratricopeptide (TPR) repeat protein
MKKGINLFWHYIKNQSQIKILFLLLGCLFFMQSCEKQIKKKISQQNRSAEIKRISKKADAFFDNSVSDSAYLYFNKVILLCDPKTDDVEDYVYALSAIANLQQNNSDYTGSEETLTKTLPYLKRIKNPKFTYNVYTLLAYNYFCNYDYNSAILYHLKALKLAKTSFKKSEIINDIILIYFNQERYSEAAEILIPLAAKKITNKKKPKRADLNYSLLLDNLGYCYYKLGNPKALECLNKSLKIKLVLKDNFSLIGTYTTLSICYSKTNKKLSKMYAEEAYNCACKVNSASWKANTLAVLMGKTEGNKLRKYTLDYIKLIDSITIGRRKAKNQFANIKYASKKDKEENLQLKAQKIENELQIERQKNRIIVSYVIIVFVLGLFLFLSCYLTSKAKKEKNDAVLKSEMRISKKLHDELSNNIHSTLAFAGNKNLELPINKNKLLNDLEIIYTRTRDISRENSPIITSEKYTFYLKEMISRFNTSNTTLLLSDIECIPWNEIEKNKKIIVYRALQELLVNMKKYSHATLVGITFKKTDKSIIITYTDNGKGIDLNTITFKNGLHNVENRILAIKGEIDIDSAVDKGFKVFIKFPLS